MNDVRQKINTETVLFFDLDGTLIDTDFANFLSFKDAIKSVIGIDEGIQYKLNERFNRTVLKNMFPDLTDIEYENIINQKELNYSGNISKTKRISFTTDILTQYAKTNMTVLVTNCREERALMTLNYHNLKDKFLHMFFRKSTDKNVHINKFENALAILGLSPKSVIVFENEVFEIEEAIKAGISLKNIILVEKFMEQFTVKPTKDHKGTFYLDRDVKGYFHSAYSSGAGQWQVQGTIENIICILKNDITPEAENVLQNVCNQLEHILLNDLPQILKLTKNEHLTVCTIPRAKVNYNANQLYFKKTVSKVASQLSGFIDGTNFIVRKVDTKTTHRARAGYGGNGDMPYPGITKNTCYISDDIKDKDILLIDDLYTNSVNIDEDAIQALFDKGAKSVVFYSIGAKLTL